LSGLVSHKELKMKFLILDKSGHSPIRLKTKAQVKEKFKELKEKGFNAVTKDGLEVVRAEDIPNTVEELVWGKDVEFSGLRGD